MDGKALEKFRGILTAMKSELTEHAPMKVGNECSRGDDADVTQNHMNSQLLTELNARNSAHIRRIDVALARIRSGGFGHCTECEEPIEERRLELRPITTLCASCKEDEERAQSDFIQNRRKRA